MVHMEPTKHLNYCINPRQRLTSKSITPEGPGFPGGPWRKRDMYMLEHESAVIEQYILCVHALTGGPGSPVSPGSPRSPGSPGSP